MKIRYALVFALLPFSALAQNLDASAIVAYDLYDPCWGEVVEQSTIPAPMMASEPTIKLDQVDEAAPIPGSDNAEAMSVGTIVPDDKTQIAPETMPARIVASEQMLTEVHEAVEEIAITGASDVESFPQRTSQSDEEILTVQGTMPAPTSADASVTKVEKASADTDEVVITGANDAGESPVPAIEASEQSQTLAAQMVAAEPTIEEPADAVEETNGIADEQTPLP